MSHSYRQSPIVGRHNISRVTKKITNRLVRRLPVDAEDLGNHNEYRRQFQGFGGRRDRKWFVSAPHRTYQVNMKVDHIPKGDVTRQAESYHKLLHNNRRDRRYRRDAKQLYLLAPIQ